MPWSDILINWSPSSSIRSPRLTPVIVNWRFSIINACLERTASMHKNPSDDELKKILTHAHTIAMVGASSNPDRASHGIMQQLQSVGYRVIPVNPRETEVLGEKAYASLADIPVPVDIVDVFRRPEDTPAIADEAVQIGAKTLWLQQG